MKITTISDTHGKHKHIIPKYLPGGDVLIHCGDFEARDERSLHNFCHWFDSIDNYDTKIFIAGNHDTFLEYYPSKSLQIINSYDSITYLQDQELVIDGVKFYGTPWQPQFYNWAFNLPRAGKELEKKWEMIPMDTDVLITHCPPMYILDTSGYPMNDPLLGCVLLEKRVKVVKPKIHTFGHIHGGYGQVFQDDIHFVNSCLLNEQYIMVNYPINLNLD